MLFAEFFNDFCGWSFLLLLGLFWRLKCFGKAAADAAKNPTVQEAAKVGFWTWFLSDDR